MYNKHQEATLELGKDTATRKKDMKLFTTRHTENTT